MHQPWLTCSSLFIWFTFADFANTFPQFATFCKLIYRGSCGQTSFPQVVENPSSLDFCAVMFGCFMQNLCCEISICCSVSAADFVRFYSSCPFSLIFLTSLRQLCATFCDNFAPNMETPKKRPRGVFWLSLTARWFAAVSFAKEFF